MKIIKHVKDNIGGYLLLGMYALSSGVPIEEPYSWRSPLPRVVEYEKDNKDTIKISTGPYPSSYDLGTEIPNKKSHSDAKLEILARSEDILGQSAFDQTKGHLGLQETGF